MKHKQYIIAPSIGYKPLRFEITDDGKTIKIESGVELIGELSIEQMSGIKNWFQHNLNTNRKDTAMVLSAHNAGDAYSSPKLSGNALDDLRNTQIVEIGKQLTATTFQDSARLRALSRDLKAIADQTN